MRLRFLVARIVIEAGRSHLVLVPEEGPAIFETIVPVSLEEAKRTHLGDSLHLLTPEVSNPQTGTMFDGKIWNGSAWQEPTLRPRRIVVS